MPRFPRRSRRVNALLDKNSSDSRHTYRPRPSRSVPLWRFDLGFAGFECSSQGYVWDMAKTNLITALTASILLGLGSLGVAACSDEDGDGGTTDEEIEDVEDTVDSVQDEVEEEIDSQGEGSNEDNE